MSTNFVFAPERDWKTEGDQKGMRESSTLACLDLGKLFLYKVKEFHSFFFFSTKKTTRSRVQENGNSFSY